MKKPFKQGYRVSENQSRLFQQQTTVEKPHCSKCKRELSDTEPKYQLKENGVAKDYCQPCAKAKLKPQEERAEA